MSIEKPGTGVWARHAEIFIVFCQISIAQAGSRLCGLILCPHFRTRLFRETLIWCHRVLNLLPKFQCHNFWITLGCGRREGSPLGSCSSGLTKTGCVFQASFTTAKSYIEEQKEAAHQAALHKQYLLQLAAEDGCNSLHVTREIWPLPVSWASAVLALGGVICHPPLREGKLTQYIRKVLQKVARI